MIDQIAAPGSVAEQVEEKMLLEDILAILTPSQRKVVEGLVIEGLSEWTVARSLGVSQHTVNKAKRAALRRIGSRLVRGR